MSQDYKRIYDFYRGTMSTDYRSERDRAAKKAILTTYCDSDATAYDAFKSGWDECLTDSSVVWRLVEALKFECGNRCAEENPCNAKEAYRIYEAFIAAMKDVTK